MAYTSDALKKEYRKETDKKRTKNLKEIRENIARLSLSDFAKETGITKNDLSMLENGDKLLSLFHIQAYKKFFLENYKINLSVDFIMGFTDIMENNNLNYQNEIGLSNDAIEMLKILSNYKAKYQSVMPGLGADIDVINTLLEYQFYITKKAESTNNLPKLSIFHFIKQYFYSDKFERELQDRLRICDGNVWVDIENGDILQKGNKQYKVMSSEAINSKTGSGTNSKTLHIFNTQNPKDRYVVDIAKVFSTYSKDNIFKELDKIKEYLETKNNKERK